MTTLGAKPALARILREWEEWRDFVSLTGFARKHGYSISGMRRLLLRHGAVLPRKYRITPADAERRAAKVRMIGPNRRRAA